MDSGSAWISMLLNSFNVFKLLYMVRHALAAYIMYNVTQFETKIAAYAHRLSVDNSLQ